MARLTRPRNPSVRFSACITRYDSYFSKITT